jgi:hypothetical protein
VPLGSALSNLIVVRVLFLIQCGRDGRSTFLQEGQLRYHDANLVTDEEMQMYLLPDKYKWMLARNRVEPLSLEWHAVFRLVGWITSADRTWIERIVNGCVETGLVSEDVAKSVEAFTDAATSEAIASDCKACPICEADFSDPADDADDEPAVKTQCAHFFGKTCL